MNRYLLKINRYLLKINRTGLIFSLSYTNNLIDSIVILWARGPSVKQGVPYVDMSKRSFVIIGLKVRIPSRELFFS